MAFVFVVTRPDRPEVQQMIPVNKKLVLGSSVYCDVVLEDKSVAGMQCQIQTGKTGHIIVTNLDLKKEVLVNQTRLKKAAIKPNDVLKIGPYLITLDHSQLTPEDLNVLNSEYEEFV